MTHRTLILAAAAATALSLAACKRPTDITNNTVTTPTADNSTQPPNSGPAATVASAVDKAQDATAGAVGAATAAVSPMDVPSFAAAAASSDMYEVRAARIALQRSRSPEVKAFAQMMIADHTASTVQLGKLTHSLGVALPTDLDERRTGMLDNLKSAQDKDFDKTYLDQQVAAHSEALTILRKYSDKGGNSDLVAFAATVAAKVQMHFDKAKALRAGVDAATNDRRSSSHSPGGHDQDQQGAAMPGQDRHETGSRHRGT